MDETDIPLGWWVIKGILFNVACAVYKDRKQTEAQQEEEEAIFC